MTKKEQKLQIIIREAFISLASAIGDAEKSSGEYSDDIHARRSYECGYLGSRIKYVVQLMEEAEQVLNAKKIK